LIRYYIASQMISYGLAKMFGMQFGFPSPNRLSTELGDFSPMGLMIRICIVLGIKAGLYYYSRHLGMNSILAWIDVVLTLFLFISLMYNANDNVIGKGTAGNTVAIMSLLVGVWTLVQLAVFVNFMALKYISDKKEIQGRK